MALVPRVVRSHWLRTTYSVYTGQTLLFISSEGVRCVASPGSISVLLSLSPTLYKPLQSVVSG